MRLFSHPVTMKVNNRNVCHQSNNIIPPPSQLLLLLRRGEGGDVGMGGPLWSPADPLRNLNSAHPPVPPRLTGYKYQDMAVANGLQPDWMQKQFACHLATRLDLYHPNRHQ